MQRIRAHHPQARCPQRLQVRPPTSTASPAIAKSSWPSCRRRDTRAPLRKETEADTTAAPYWNVANEELNELCISVKVICKDLALCEEGLYQMLGDCTRAVKAFIRFYEEVRVSLGEVPPARSADVPERDSAGARALLRTTCCSLSTPRKSSTGSRTLQGTRSGSSCTSDPRSK